MGEPRKFRLAVSCGGTGGHFFPGLAVAREFASTGADVTLILSGREAESQTALAAQHGLESIVVSAAPLTKHPIRVWGMLWKQFRGCSKVSSFFRQNPPDAVLTMGSFTSIPAVMTAVEQKIPLFLHDGNARIGKANRFFSKYARLLMTAFPAVNTAACKCSVECVGLPLRPEFLQNTPLPRVEAVRQINELFNTDLTPDLPLILVFGGSQGARSINTIIPEALEQSVHPFQVIHLTGKGNLREEMYGTRKALVLESSDRMDLLYAVADHVISRAGGSTLSELACLGKDALVIPYPFASEDHQTDNANVFVAADAVQMIPESEMDADKIMGIVEGWFTDPAASQARSKAMRQLAKPNAARFIASIIRKRSE